MLGITTFLRSHDEQGHKPQDDHREGDVETDRDSHHGEVDTELFVSHHPLRSRTSPEIRVNGV